MENSSSFFRCHHSFAILFALFAFFVAIPFRGSGYGLPLGCMTAELDCVALKVALPKHGLAADQIHPLARNEIHHARPFALAAH